jgi:aminodeoxyfutalosine deaminase
VSLGGFLAALPKVELHIHLEGSMPPETLLALARRHRVSLPVDDVEGLREWFRFRDFDHFVEVYLACSKVLRAPEDFQRLLSDFAVAQERQNIRYSEVHFTIGTHWMNGLPVDEVLDALEETIRDEQRRRGVRVRLIPDIVRDVGNRTADPTLDWALEAHERGIAVALGLTGREAVSPSEPYADHFAAAAAAGLHCVAHAGEHAGPASVEAVLGPCRAERVGHGVRSIEDSGLVARLAERRTPLEICPSSNVALGVVPDLASHPFDRLRRAGVELSVNTDDPSLFDTDLAREYEKLAESFGYDAETLVELALAGVRHSFLPDAEKSKLEAEIRSEAERLAPRHLGRELAPAPAV